jgi:hypothetical protein
MKPTDALNPDTMAADKQLPEPANAQPTVSQNQDTNSSPAGLEIFYDGREVYGGY